jgi:hypothetical protein
MKMKTSVVSLVCAGLSGLACAATESISVNIIGGHPNGSRPGASVYDASSSATLGGYAVPVCAWNDIYQQQNGSSATNITSLMTYTDDATGSIGTRACAVSVQAACTYSYLATMSATTLAGKLLFGYLDDGNLGDGWGSKVSIVVPYESYDLYVYFGTDSTSGSTGRGAIRVSDGGVDTMYIGNGSKTVAVTANTKWGTATDLHEASGALTLTEGKQYLKVSVTNNTGTVVLRGSPSGTPGSTRTGIAAFQIVNTGAAVSASKIDYAANITDPAATWAADRTGLTENTPWANGSINTITLTNDTVDATLTFQQNVKAASLTAVGGKSLTLASNGSTITIPAYDFAGMTASNIVAFATGTASIAAGANTILTQAGTGTLAIGAGKKLTLNGFTWNPAFLTSSGTLGIRGGTRGAPIAMTSGAGLPGTVYVEAGSVFKHTATGGNKFYTVDGAGADTSTYILESDRNWGMSDGSTFRNVKVVTSPSYNFWLERLNGTDASVDFEILGEMHYSPGTNILSVGSISGAGPIIREGGTVLNVNELRGPTTYSGAFAPTLAVSGPYPLTLVTVSAGQLVVNADGHVILSGSCGTITNNGSLAFAPEAGMTMTPAAGFSSTGLLIQDGAGMTDLSYDSNCPGSCIVSNGTLRLAEGIVFGGNVTVKSGATLDLAATGASAKALFHICGGTLTVEDGATILANGAALEGTGWHASEGNWLNGTESVTYSRTLTSGATTNIWSDALWTLGGNPNVGFSPSAGQVANATLTITGDTILMVDGTPSQLGIVNVALSGASSATLTLLYQAAAADLPTNSTYSVRMASLGHNLFVANGVAVVSAIANAGYTSVQSDGDIMYIAKRPGLGAISVKIGPRAESNKLGWLTPEYDNVGAEPLSALFWSNTYASTQAARYSDIIHLTDAKNGDSSIKMAFYGENAWYSSSPATTGNGILTKAYLDDTGNHAASVQFLITNRNDATETITLPAGPAGQARGWQLRISNIPYNAYDVYFITASDVLATNLLETPIYVSLDSGANWSAYAGDSVNHKTILSTANWTGSPYEEGALVQGKNYIKMRISKTLYGDDISTIDITHGTRDLNANPKIRSGLAGIQIVEVENDGVYTRMTTGNWSASSWMVGTLTGQLWQDTTEELPTTANIVASAVCSSVTLDTDVSAYSVLLSGSKDFSFLGSHTLASEQGINASQLQGKLTLEAPINGTVLVGSGVTVIADYAADADYPYSLSGPGHFSKTGAGTLSITNAFGLIGDMGITNGTLRYPGGTAMPIAAAAGATFVSDPVTNASVTLSGAITGGGNFIKTGEGTTVISQILGIGGTVSVLQGKLVLACTNSTATATQARPFTVASGATLRFEGPSQNNNRMPNNGWLVADGGRVELYGVNPFNMNARPNFIMTNGATLVADCSLAPANSSHLKLGSLTLADSALVITGTQLAWNTNATAVSEALLANTLRVSGSSSASYLNSTYSNELYPSLVDVAPGGVFSVSVYVEALTKTGLGTIVACEGSRFRTANIMQGTLKIPAAAGTFWAATMADGTTLDITERTSAFDWGSLLTVADGSTVNVDVTGRSLQPGDVLLSWTAAPAGKFKLVGLPSYFAAKKTATGLEVYSAGMTIMLQ